MGKPCASWGCSDWPLPLHRVARSAATVSTQYGRALAFAATRLRVRKLSLSTTRSGTARGSVQIWWSRSVAYMTSPSSE